MFKLELQLEFKAIFCIYVLTHFFLQSLFFKKLKIMEVYAMY